MMHTLGTQRGQSRLGRPCSCSVGSKLELSQIAPSLFGFIPALLQRRSIECGVAQPSTSSTVTQINGASHEVSAETGAVGSLKSGDFEIDSVLERELSENGTRSTRRTKIICTIGPETESIEKLSALAANGMNVARLNMCHGTHEWHQAVIERIRQMNKDNGYSVAIMVDTEGSEVHTDARVPIKCEKGQEFTLTVRAVGQDEDPHVVQVSYDAFIDDVQVGDEVVVDGGMVLLEVTSKAGPDVMCTCIEPGIMLARANLTMRRSGKLLRGRNTMLPVITSKDWLDIDFAIKNKTDFLAISFVKSADVLTNLRSYIALRAEEDWQPEIIAKLESFDSVPNMEQIVNAADGIMVARGDLGAQVASEDVPGIQKEAVMRCRIAGKPCMVAAQLLESMIEFPIPTRAEVADIADVVRQRADGMVLSAETAVGDYPEKAVSTLRQVSTEVEQWCREDMAEAFTLPQIATDDQGAIREQVCSAACNIANAIGARAIFVFTRRGVMAQQVSRNRPDCPIFAFTDSQVVRQHLNLRWGVMPFRVEFLDDPELNVERTFRLLKKRELVREGDTVVVVSDIQPGSTNQKVRSVQVRQVT